MCTVGDFQFSQLVKSKKLKKPIMNKKIDPVWTWPNLPYNILHDGTIAMFTLSKSRQVTTKKFERPYLLLQQPGAGGGAGVGADMGRSSRNGSGAGVGVVILIVRG